MSDLRNKVIKLAYNKKELRKDLLPLLKETQQGRIASALDNFQEAASNFASSYLTELDYDTQQDLMQAISKVHRGGKPKNPKKLLQSLMRDRQNIQGKPGTVLDRMIHALEDMATRTSSQKEATRTQRLFVRVDEIFFDTERPMSQEVVRHLSWSALKSKDKSRNALDWPSMTDLEFYNVTQRGGAAVAEFEWEVPDDAAADVDAHKEEVKWFLRDLKRSLEYYLNQDVSVSAETLVLGPPVDREFNIRIKAR